MTFIQPRRFSGTRDYLPADMIPREDMINALRCVFAQFGYDPLETPAIEYLDVLCGKYGPDAEKLIYALDYKRGTTDEAGLRYDLTVPLARLAAMSASEIELPFRRYQIQTVWRAERAQVRQGRYREFYQCDVDCIGVSSLSADAEIIAVVVSALNALGLSDATVLLNHRRLLRGMTRILGLPLERERDLLRSIDKFSKIGADGVQKELEAQDFSSAQASDAIGLFVGASQAHDPMAHILEKAADDEDVCTAAAELRELLAIAADLGVAGSSVRFDPLMVRGLDYYTGPVFETFLPSLPHMGSLTGGGRYDGLIGMFLGRDIPAVGTTVGLDRIFTALEQLGIVKRRNTRAVALVACFDAQHSGYASRVASALRSSGINIAVYPEADKLKKQFKYADKLGVSFVVLIGPDEAASDCAVLKDLSRGEQVTVSICDLAATIMQRLAELK